MNLLDLCTVVSCFTWASGPIFPNLAKRADLRIHIVGTGVS